MTLMETPDLTSSTARMLLFGLTANEHYHKNIDGHEYSVRIYSQKEERLIHVQVYSHSKNVSHLKELPKGTRLSALYAEADALIEEFEQS